MEIIQSHFNVIYEENILVKKINAHTSFISDISLNTGLTSLSMVFLKKVKKAHCSYVYPYVYQLSLHLAKKKTTNQ